jgi:hypothetical protein
MWIAVAVIAPVLEVGPAARTHRLTARLPGEAPTTCV